jgi:BirA family biotin operon repressor/biotin-[acetyl-CoA-carboxylase] ligase
MQKNVQVNFICTINYLSVMSIGSVIRHFEKVTSTNTLAASMIRETRPQEGTIITASFQEGGRGLGANRWESEPGKNLLMSVILYPVMVCPGDQFIISQCVSLAVRDVVSMHTQDVSIKWPNDIYVSNDKIAGILIEHSIMGDTLESTVAGIGLNINQTVFTGETVNPVSLCMLTGKSYDINAIASELITFLDSRYKMVTTGKIRQLEEEYHDALFRRGEWHRYTDSRGEFEGKIDSVAPDGILTVFDRNGESGKYAFKEIDYIL